MSCRRFNMPQLVVGNALRAAARKFPDKVAFIFKDQRITYKKFEDRVNRLANGLLAKGCKPGDHVSILAYNCIEYYEILFALGKAGMVAVPINFRLVGDEILYISNNSDAKFFIYEAPFAGIIKDIQSKLFADGYVVFGGDGNPGDTKYEELLASSSPADIDVVVDENTTWYIGYTSGTTGKPKGGVRSHRANMLLALSNVYGLSQDTVSLLIMPILHYNSITYGIVTVYLGGTIVIYPSGSFNGREVLEIMEREKVTYSSMVPTMYTIILSVPDKDKFDLSSVKKLLTSSAPLMTKTREEILAFFKEAELFEAYGATELGTTTCLRPKDQYRKIRSCGQAVSYGRIKLINDKGEECAPGEVGELYAFTPGLFQGYYKDPEKTAQAFMGEFVTVGDMATVDEEGYYYIVDRKNDLIISGGENIYPTEVDNLIAKHPEIIGVATIGVPDDKWGEAVKVVAVKKPGSSLTDKELIAYCKQNLAGYKCPKTVEFWDELPLNATGKIMKRIIRDKFWVGKGRSI